MKKVLLVIILLFCNKFIAQISTTTEKIGKLLYSLESSNGNASKLDSIKSEAIKLYGEVDDVKRKKMITDIIQLTNEMRNTLSVITPFESLDKETKNKYRYKFDKFKNIAFIEAKGANQNNIYSYLAIKDSNVTMRLVTQFRGSGWLFFSKATFIIDGKNYQYIIPSTDRDLGNAKTVTETSDLSVDDNILSILEAITLSSSKIEYRLSGDKYIDMRFTEKEKKDITLILDLYKKLSSKP